MFSQKCVIYINGDNVLINGLSPNDNLSTSKNINMFKKTVSLRDFISLIKSSDQSLSTKYFCNKAVKYEQTSNRIILHLFSEPCKVNLKARGNDGIVEYNNAAFPGYVMLAEFDLSGRFYGSRIRAVKDCYSPYDFSEKMKTYIMPFPNIYSSSDNICWSSTLRGLEINLKNADLILNIFNTSVFNYDLFGVALDKIRSVQPEVNTLHDYFNFLTTVDEFPEQFYFESW